MNPWAAAVIAARPTDGVPSLIVRDPCSAKKDATLAAFWLHQAAVYRAAKSFSLFPSIRFLSDVKAVKRLNMSTNSGLERCV